MKPKILKYPHPDLRKKARTVDNKDGVYTSTIQTLIEILEAEDGLGLAATQVDGYACRIIVIKTRLMGGVCPVVMLNPEIIEVNGNQHPSREGCLSFPDIFGTVPRYQSLKVKYENEKGKIVTKEAFGEFAEAIQHEIDHLDGILFIDKMNKKDLKKNKAALRRLEKKHKKN